MKLPKKHPPKLKLLNNFKEVMNEDSAENYTTNNVTANNITEDGILAFDMQSPIKIETNETEISY